MPTKRQKTDKAESDAPVASTSSAAPVTIASAGAGAGTFAGPEEALALALLTACLENDLNAVQVLVGEGADAWVQDAQGWTALHAAASHGNTEMCNFLLRKGNAVWNLVDNLGLTAADLAWSMNAESTYELLTGEGVRAELIRAAMEAAAASGGQDEDSEMDEDDEAQAEAAAEGDEAPAKAAEDEVKLSTASDNATFLASKIIYRLDERGQEIAEDAEGNGVMMGWERPIMERTARRLCEAFEWRRTATATTKSGVLKREDAPPPEEAEDEDEEELVVVNVGFGLGIIDSYLQEYKPTTHLIIEPHPDVLAHAKETGWFDKPGVRFYEGTWQQYLKDLEDEKEDYLVFDAVYFDTYSEHYSDLRAFFDVLPNWLRSDEARFSFFHGLGATSRCFYDVYTTVSELHLRDMGLVTEWEEVDLHNEWVWDGLEKRYWGEVGPYRLPVSRLEM